MYRVTIDNCFEIYHKMYVFRTDAIDVCKTQGSYEIRRRSSRFKWLFQDLKHLYFPPLILRLGYIVGPFTWITCVSDVVCNSFFGYATNSSDADFFDISQCSI